MCFGCSKEPSHQDGSFEYPQHKFWLNNKKNNFQLRTLIWGPGKPLATCDFPGGGGKGAVSGPPFPTLDPPMKFFGLFGEQTS